MCTLLSHFSENGRFGSTVKISAAKSQRCARLSKYLRLLTNLLSVWLNPLWSSNSNVENDLVYRFCPVKPVPLQDSRIFRIHILLNFTISVFGRLSFSEFRRRFGRSKRIHPESCEMLLSDIQNKENILTWYKFAFAWLKLSQQYTQTQRQRRKDKGGTFRAEN